MNAEDIHVRAEQLIARDFVEGISESERAWLDGHLQGCRRCADVAETTGAALRSLKSTAIAVPAGLARTTQFRVRLRAREHAGFVSRRRVLWVACGISWAFGIATAPLVWQGLQTLAQRFSLSRPLPEMAFGLWWALPAIVAGAVVLAENARMQRERDAIDQQD